MVETAIVFPIMIFLILGALQLVMMQHARVMTEYAAYNAARAGIVHNANWNLMRNAALVSVLPIYGRTDSFGNFMLMWAKIKILNEATELVDTTTATLESAFGDLLGMIGLNISFSSLMPNISPVEINVRSPREADFRRALRWQQNRQSQAESIDPQGPLDYPDDSIDFDERELIREQPRAGRLALEVRVLYPLRIPIVNQIFFHLWFAQEALRAQTLESSITDWAAWEARVERGQGAGQKLSDLVDSFGGSQSSLWQEVFLARNRRREALLLRRFADATGVYMIPLRGSYAMQMQSNPFEQNRRQPVWFSISD